MWAHPRSRGEHAEHAGRESSGKGSSPLARGTRRNLRGVELERGLIPARAGNTPMNGALWVLKRAHPRSRGEHPSRRARWSRIRGSSPLARGTRCLAHGKLNRYGLIPARAGNTSFLIFSTSIDWAHPRSRGEHWGFPRCLFPRPGSSPLARGTLHGFLIDFNNNGLIPARAGNTFGKLTLK